MWVIFATGLRARIETMAGIWLALACLWTLVDQPLGIGLPAFLPRFLILRHVAFFVAGITFYRIAGKGLTRPRAALILPAPAAPGPLDGPWDTDVPAVGRTDRPHPRRIAISPFSPLCL